MIVVRNVFRLKYGQARPALTFKEAKELASKFGVKQGRVMTDLVGPAWYQKFTPLVESGYREIFTEVE